MPDEDALAMKIGFGALVLAFCVVVTFVRKPADSAPVPAPAQAVVTPLAPMQPDSAESAAVSDRHPPAPLDVHEDETPVRIDVHLFDRKPPSRARKSMIVPTRAEPVAQHRARPSPRQPARPPRDRTRIGEPPWFAPGR